MWVLIASVPVHRKLVTFRNVNYTLYEAKLPRAIYDKPLCLQMTSFCRIWLTFIRITDKNVCAFKSLQHNLIGQIDSVYKHKNKQVRQV